MVSFTVYEYGLLLQCNIMELAERNTHSKAAEETEMHKVFSLILRKLAVQILNSGPLDPSIGKLFHLIEKSFTHYKIIRTKEKSKKDVYIYISFPFCPQK